MDDTIRSANELNEGYLRASDLAERQSQEAEERMRWFEENRMRSNSQLITPEQSARIDEAYKKVLEADRESKDIERRAAALESLLSSSPLVEEASEPVIVPTPQAIEFKKIIGYILIGIGVIAAFGNITGAGGLGDPDPERAKGRIGCYVIFIAAGVLLILLA